MCCTNFTCTHTHTQGLYTHCKRPIISWRGCGQQGERGWPAHQEGLVELEGAGELALQLVNTVQPLQEDWAALVQVLRVLAVSAAVGKLVAKVQPLCFHQHLKALQGGGETSQQQVRSGPGYTGGVTGGVKMYLDGAVVRIQKQFG